MAAACHPQTLVNAEDPPAGIDFIAAVLEDSDGEIRSVSPLLDRGDEFVSKAVGTAALRLVGFTRADLDSSIGAPPTRSEEPLARASECQPALPPPAWSHWSVIGAPMSEDPRKGAPPHRLGAEWLDGRCEMNIRNDALVADVRCVALRCSSEVLDLGGCRASINLGRACNELPISPEIWRRLGGGFCVEQTSAGGRCTRLDNHPEGSFASVECEAGDTGRCRIDLYESGLERTFNTQSEVIRGAGAPLSPDPNGPTGFLTPVCSGRWTFGHVFDFVETGTAARIVAVPDCNGGGGRGLRGEVLFLDDRLKVARTATLSGCVTRLAPTLDGDGFFGLHEVQGNFQIARFDSSAKITRSVDLGLLPDGARPMILEVSPGGERIIAAFIVRNPGVERPMMRGFSVSSDLRDPPIAGPDIPDFEVCAAAAAGSGRVAMVNNRDDQLEVFDWRLGGHVRYRAHEELIGSNLSDVAWHEGTNHAVLATRIGRTEQGGALAFIDLAGNPDARPAYAANFDRPAAGSAVSPWPGDPDRMLVALLDQDLRASLTLADVREKRFFPGAHPIGHGPVSRIRRDSRGRLLLLLPWEGRIIRLTP